MLVSIVCPLYQPNVIYFEQVLRSIERQSYPNIEVVFSDDYPQNGIEQFIKGKLTKEYRYIVNKGQRGIFSNLNNAIQHAKGDLIQILCQDDLLFDVFITRQVARLTEFPEAGIVFSQFHVIDEESRIMPLSSRYDIRKKWPSFIPRESALNYLLVYGCMPGNLSPVMIRRAVIDKIGYFDQSFPFAGDFEFWSRVAKCFGFAYNVDPLLAIRGHNEQASKKLGLDKVVNDRVHIYRFLSEHCSLKKSKIYVKWLINQEAGVQQLYHLVKEWKQYQTKRKIMLRQMNTKPFSIFISAVLTLLTVNGRFKLFTVSQKEL